MGGQKGIALFYKYLSRLVGLNCLTIQKNEPNEEFVVIHQISNSKWRYLNPMLFFKMKKIADETNRTHLLFEHPYYAWLILLFKVFSSKKIIVHSHNIESERFKSIGKWWWRLLWLYEQAAYKMADVTWFKTEEDKHYATLFYKVHEDRCFVIPYGVENIHLPEPDEISRCKEWVNTHHQIETNTTLILFNGTLNYKPNLDALNHILYKINPDLLKSKLNYKILVCGKGLPADMNELQNFTEANIIYCGFVEDIDLYFKACDIFLNPLQDGGGIKTKLVEALGFGKFCISSENGAIGVQKEFAPERLVIVADKDWNAYVHAILQAKFASISNNHSKFYTHFSWSNIAFRAVQSISES